MPHLLLHQTGDALGGVAGRVPVGEREQQQVAAVAVVLLQFEKGLLAGDDVSAVAVDEDDPREPVIEEAPREVLEHVEVTAGGSGQRAGEVEVVVRVAEPLERREQALPRDRRELHAAQDLAQQERVGEHRHVPAVLFERGDGEDDRRVLG